MNSIALPFFTIFAKFQIEIIMKIQSAFISTLSFSTGLGVNPPSPKAKQFGMSSRINNGTSFSCVVERGGSDSAKLTIQQTFIDYQRAQASLDPSDLSSSFLISPQTRLLRDIRFDGIEGVSFKSVYKGNELEFFELELKMVKQLLKVKIPPDVKGDVNTEILKSPSNFYFKALEPYPEDSHAKYVSTVAFHPDECPNVMPNIVASLKKQGHYSVLTDTHTVLSSGKKVSSQVVPICFRQGEHAHKYEGLITCAEGDRWAAAFLGYKSVSECIHNFPNHMKATLSQGSFNNLKKIYKESCENLRVDVATSISGKLKQSSKFLEAVVRSSVPVLRISLGLEADASFNKCLTVYDRGSNECNRDRHKDWMERLNWARSTVLNQTFLSQSEIPRAPFHLIALFGQAHAEAMIPDLKSLMQVDYGPPNVSSTFIVRNSSGSGEL